MLWTRLPSEPVIVTVYEPPVPEQDNVEVPLLVVTVRLMLVGEVLHVRPVDGEIVVDNETVPARPWRPVAVIVDVPEADARTVRLVGFAAMVKSCTV
jgi:hypothetical protein